MGVRFRQTTAYHTNMRIFILIIGGRGGKIVRSKISYILRKRISQFLERDWEGIPTDGQSRKENKETIIDIREGEELPSVQEKTVFTSFGRTHKYFTVLRAPLQIVLFLIVNLRDPRGVQCQRILTLSILVFRHPSPPRFT